MELLIPFANTGEKEDFSTTTDPTGKVSLEKGFTELYELKPEEGGLFILRKVFNQMMNLVTTDTVTWKTQTFPNWIADKGNGLPYAYPANAIVEHMGDNWVSMDNENTEEPSTGTLWINLKDYFKLNINLLPNKTTPVDTDNFAIQETGSTGALKKLSWANLKETLKSIFLTKPELITITGTATFNGTTQTIDMTGIGNLTLGIGDVIQINSPLNNRLHTVESIPNANQIIVNYEHRGTSTPVPKGRLIAETVTATITLYNRAKNAPSGQGQYWCVPASGRVKGTEYANNTKREIKVSVSYTYSSGASATIYVDNFPTTFSGGVGSMNIGEISINEGSIYKFESASSILTNGWVEQR